MAEWVAYLRDLGVREMRVDAAGSATDIAQREAPAAATARAKPAEPPRAATTVAPANRASSLFESGAGFDEPAAADPAARLETIRQELGPCTRCPLHEERTNIVFGVGDPRARLMFIGEGPGADEDAQGEPFVGRAGKKLDEMITALGLQRSEVYIANVVKCRPPGNRDPAPIEVATCSPFLEQQIRSIAPRAIVTLGKPASSTLLGRSVAITRARGIWEEWNGIPLMPTFHPAYILRQYTRENRQAVWDDLKAVRELVDAS